jgi:hypothetical protein
VCVWPYPGKTHETNDSTKTSIPILSLLFKLIKEMLINNPIIKTEPKCAHTSGACLKKQSKEFNIEILIFES